MNLPLKDGTEHEIPADFIAELSGFYYGVETELYKMRLWCLANPERRKTKRGARRFVFNWINKACTVKPKAAPRAEIATTAVSTESLDARKSHLAALKGALTKC